MRLLMLLRAIFNAYANYTKNPLRSTQLTQFACFYSNITYSFYAYINYVCDPMQELKCVHFQFYVAKNFNNTIKTPRIKTTTFPKLMYTTEIG